MGFLDKLLKKGAADALRELMGSQPANAPQQSAPQQPAPQQYAPQQTAEEESPSGWSWGEKMPDEENQYNFSGTYDKYFDTVLREAFPDYEITTVPADREHGYYPSSRPAKVITFRKDGRTALMIELVSCRSDRRKLRRECRASGTPYLRYYYDYEGWWNTKSYVIDRTRRALEG